jgi:hypothetical protein
MILVAVGLVVAGLGATWIGARRQQNAWAADIERLVRGRAAHGVAAPAGAQVLERLPPPVARYLRLALPSPKPILDVRIRQTGTLRTDATSERWMAFDAEHVVVPAAPGFVWNARVRVAPLLHVRVRDALIDGRGSGQVSLMSAFPMSADAGGIEMNSGSLHRYLAEAVWYPTALLPSAALTWTDIDATRALATLTSRGVTVSLEFRFADNGEVTGIFTPARWGTFPGGYRQVPWEGHFRDYRERDGVVVPAEGEVGWYIDNEWRAVWKGVVVGYDARRQG